MNQGSSMKLLVIMAFFMYLQTKKKPVSIENALMEQ